MVWMRTLEVQNPLILKLKESTRLMYNGDIAINAGRSAMRCAGGTCFWPKSANGLVNIPYTLSSAYAPENRSLITNAMTEFASLTCIRFVPRTNEVDYLSIISESGCWSSMGRSGGAQDLSLDRSGCIVHGVIQHELNHALGFEHEHSRSDRDSYIKVMWNNIIPEYKDAFNKIDTNNLGLEYDYSSVMHYGKYTFSRNYLLPSIEPILNKFTPIGQRFGLSNLDVAKINRLYGCNICSSVLSDFGGTFSSASYPSSYPNNNNCTWLIRVPSDKVALQFSAFDIQTSRDCASDYIRVFDGSSRTSPLLLDRSCGTGQMPYLVSSRNALLVEFITDQSVTATGFRASYSTVTCGGTFTAPKGEVSSPGYDQMKLYPPYADCTWTILAPAGYLVRLEFVAFSLEDSDSCAYDSLEIRDGMLPTSPLLRTHCGKVKIPTVTSTRNALLLKMSSDNSEESTGFLANYAFGKTYSSGSSCLNDGRQTNRASIYYVHKVTKTIQKIDVYRNMKEMKVIHVYTQTHVESC
ncbi:embryonic protein UVS.2-like [Spea bombifrons]|uniref:embryonic protein UVS.2-like n=1 Tax=Spea bombifrons TaxID=233779 RepID=UPI00234ABF2B|nr:embryonic protein UVS.2-like [Spea bombifrons]